ncbi:N-acetyltransferase [Chroococcidiopsis cubana CCALA 043]|jgi:[ribosomal protein S5]-alanine N-acetyltransferase|uniref:GCN5-related N-acetyltransferase n=2 Tax=Chroococcidiopsis TaxID=54298 RepID=K9U5B4_CHRTP|nr:MULTISPECIES: GNAT family N-acetyltransferase [Chroococcidiopsis]MBE9018329.1 GNAT family N-acetyltransferase [Chroococcidiopsidales cyanobacterium LEGE 13417]PSB43854.1 N-acetyltransferase [Cyanosarcina cf. burmensis CCALA 770]AFY89621.1 GCN5-related N-acetyltransferase [Chroococcidiopsis thermalis PCC 7203]PSB65533.1 N-acetyltransferase [Chroococcidiopsis cubana CCALA 043]PSM47136.1 N-acetyltransferase [Chroococcidiopsis sp. CCALA 051]
MTTIAQTDRLTIRSWIPEEDAESAFQIYSDPEVTRFIKTKTTSTEDAIKLLQRWVILSTQLNGGGFWAVVSKATPEILGTIILIPLRDEAEQWTQDYEIGWHLKKSAWGNGYATEAARAILNYGFNILKLPTIYSVARPENTTSIRVMQRLNMIPIGRTHKYYKMELEMFKLGKLT